MDDISKFAQQSRDASLRGESVEFADGRKWVVRSRVIGTPDTSPIKVALKKIQESDGDENAQELAMLDFCYEAVKINYPDIKKDEIVIDVDCYMDVMRQYSGQNSAKKLIGGLS
jgi:hypothetical protein